MTTYQFASNNPIQFIDLDGLEGIDPKVQRKYDNLIAKQDYEGVFKLLLKHYSKDFIEADDVPGLYKEGRVFVRFENRDDISTTKASAEERAAIVKFAQGHMNPGIELAVRVINHEWIHVQQIVFDEMGGDELHPEREVLAYYYELTNSKLPPLSNTEASNRFILGGVIKANENFNKLSSDKQEEYQDKINAINKFADTDLVKSQLAAINQNLELINNNIARFQNLIDNDIGNKEVNENRIQKLEKNKSKAERSKKIYEQILKSKEKK